MPKILLVEAAEIASWSDFAPVISAITSQFSITTIIAFLAALIAATIALNFMWWGIRRAYAAIMAAAKGRSNGVG